MQPSPFTLPLPDAAQSEFVSILEKHLSSAMDRESEVLQELSRLQVEIRQYRNFLQSLGRVAPASASFSASNGASGVEIVYGKTIILANHSNEDVNDSEDSEVVEDGSTEDSRDGEGVRHLSKKLLRLLDSTSVYGQRQFETFSKEEATQAILENEREPVAIDFNSLSEKVGQALSRLAKSNRVAKFHERGRPSRVRYMSVDWFENGVVKLPYEFVLEGLEPIAGTGFTKDNKPARNSTESVTNYDDLSLEHSEEVADKTVAGLDLATFLALGNK